MSKWRLEHQIFVICCGKQLGRNGSEADSKALEHDFSLENIHKQAKLCDKYFPPTTLSSRTLRTDTLTLT